MSTLADAIGLIIAGVENSDRTEAIVASYSSHAVRPPEFEIRPREFLAWAEDELGKPDLVSRVNCVNHLKRALECQVDAYLHTWNLLEYARNKKKSPRGLPGKLEILASLGLLNARSVHRLNQMRNRMEHEYARPDVNDLDVFYDLVAAIIGILERAMVAVDNMEVSMPTECNSVYMEVNYSMDGPRIVFELERNRHQASRVVCEMALADNPELFFLCFRILGLLADSISYLVDEDEVVAQLGRILNELPT